MARHSPKSHVLPSHMSPLLTPLAGLPCQPPTCRHNAGHTAITADLPPQALFKSHILRPRGARAPLGARRRPGAVYGPVGSGGPASPRERERAPCFETDREKERESARDRELKITAGNQAPAAYPMGNGHCWPRRASGRSRRRGRAGLAARPKHSCGAGRACVCFALLSPPTSHTLPHPTTNLTAHDNCTAPPRLRPQPILNCTSKLWVTFQAILSRGVLNNQSVRCCGMDY